MKWKIIQYKKIRENDKYGVKRKSKIRKLGISEENMRNETGGKKRRKLYAIRTRHETTDRFKIKKGVHQGCILSPCLFN